MVNNDSSIKTNGSSDGQNEALLWQLLGNGNELVTNQPVTYRNLSSELTMKRPKEHDEMSRLFHGSAICEVDQDGNVTIPEFLAEALPEDTAELLVSRHAADGCLVGYGREHLDELRARIEAWRLADEARGADVCNHYNRIRRTFGVVEKMPRAGATMRIPAAMRHLGRIGTLALFVGTGDSFEIWNPDLAVECADEQFRDLAAYRLGARGESHTGLGVH
jgi:MraZ protein